MGDSNLDCCPKKSSALSKEKSKAPARTHHPHPHNIMMMPQLTLEFAQHHGHGQRFRHPPYLLPGRPSASAGCHWAGSHPRVFSCEHRGEQLYARRRGSADYLPRVQRGQPLLIRSSSQCAPTHSRLLRRTLVSTQPPRDSGQYPLGRDQPAEVSFSSLTDNSTDQRSKPRPARN